MNAIDCRMRKAAANNDIAEMKSLGKQGSDVNK